MRDKNNSSRPSPQVYRRRVMSGVSASHLATPRTPAFCMVLRQPSRLLQMGTAFHLCLVGASHSHRLTEAENPYEQHSERYHHIIRLQSDTHRNPLSQRCGPGSLSLSLTGAVLRRGCHCIGTEIHRILRGPPNLRSLLLSRTAITSVVTFRPCPSLMRSVNCNSLGDNISACHPTDWRSPAVVMDGYNRIVEHVFSEQQQQQPEACPD